MNHASGFFPWSLSCHTSVLCVCCGVGLRAQHRTSKAFRGAQHLPLVCLPSSFLAFLGQKMAHRSSSLEAGAQAELWVSVWPPPQDHRPSEPR